MIPKQMDDFLRERLPQQTFENRLIKDEGKCFLEFGVMDVERLARLGIQVDNLGPRLVVAMWDEASHLQIGGYLVVDNLAMGQPSMGGIRMLPDVTPSAIYNLARGMTLKNTAADLPYGGGKSGIVADYGLSPDDHEAVVRGFAHLLYPFAFRVILLIALLPNIGLVFAFIKRIFKRDSFSGWLGFRVWEKLLIVLMGFYLLVRLFNTYAPPFTWDATTHHYLVPAMYLKAHCIYDLPHVVFSYYPLRPLVQRDDRVRRTAVLRREPDRSDRSRSEPLGGPSVYPLLGHGQLHHAAGRTRRFRGSQRGRRKCHAYRIPGDAPRQHHLLRAVFLRARPRVHSAGVCRSRRVGVLAGRRRRFPYCRRLAGIRRGHRRLG